MLNTPVLEGARAPGPRRMAVALIVMVLLVALLVGGVFGWQAFTGSFFKKFMEQAAAAPQIVSTVSLRRGGRHRVRFRERCAGRQSAAAAAAE
jgi:predicted negative regulator of RcsB-dependent stress response